MLTDVEFSEPEPEDVVRLNRPPGADEEMSPAGMLGSNFFSVPYARALRCLRGCFSSGVFRVYSTLLYSTVLLCCLIHVVPSSVRTILYYTIPYYSDT